MAIFKCKICGGDLEITEGITITECEYCGTKQTVPRAMDENLQNLFNRANILRIKGEFDKAERLYEKIIEADSTQSDAYWGLILCKYGVEYVDDPVTRKKIPTCHRTSYDSIVSDDDYKSALDNCDTYQRVIYEAQAKEIDRIQKEILALAQKEENYDVFICYKETDENGHRTQDSVIANDIYYQLTGEGFKVFYAAITLEGKLGNEYEPIIFAALHSAKVMLVVGTKIEHFTAVWVKNEWSRFLRIIKKDRSKLLIPCYRDMDAYELPEEFAHLQAHDMAKIGFINDIVRGIKKVIKTDASQNTATETIVTTTVAPNIAPLLKRAFLFLEDGEFDNADEYAEKVLDIDPECAEAYVVKLLVEVELRKPTDLTMCDAPLSDSNNFKKAIRFANADYRKTLEKYNDAIIERINLARKNELYNNGLELMREGQYDLAIQYFEKISTYKDSGKMINLCKESKENARKDTIYSHALKKALSFYASESDIRASISALKTIAGYKDVDDHIRTLTARLEKIILDRKKAEESAKIKAEEERRTREREAEIKRIQAKKRSERNKKIAMIATPIAIAIIVFIIILNSFIIPNSKYNDALDLMSDGKYDDAISVFESLDGYKDSNNLILECQYEIAIGMINDGQYEKALRLLRTMPSSAKTQQFTSTSSALKQLENQKFEDAIKTFLSANIPVELTYQTEGGALSDGHIFVFTSAKSFDKLKTPSRSGYRFVEWVLDAYVCDLDAENLELNLSLKAVWGTKDYTLNYDLNGGVVNGINKSEYDTEDDSFTLINPTRTGYTFMGWIGTDLSVPTINVTVPKGSCGDKSYTATWSPNQYTVIYDAAGGTISSNTQYITYATDIEYLIPERTGYKFLGWYENDTIKHEDENWTRVSDLSLVAKWEIISYTIEYQLNEGINHADNPFNYNVTTETITIEEPSRIGYTFTGWTFDGQSLPTKTLVIENGSIGNRKITANWQANLNSVVFNGNTGNGTMSNLQIATNATGVLPECSFVKKGYSFIGWSTAANGSVEYNPGDIYNMGTDSTYTLYALWDVIEYNIAYNLGGGSVSNTNTYTVDDIISITNPQMDGYAFIGWTGTGLAELTLNLVIEDSIGNKEFTAHWENYLLYEENSEGYSVTGIVDKYHNIAEIYIPSVYNNLPVTHIESLSECVMAKKLVIPNSVTTIAMGAAKGFSSLEYISLPFTGAQSDIPYDGNYPSTSVYPFGWIFGNSEYDGGMLVSQVYYYRNSYSADYLYMDFYIPQNLTRVHITNKLVDNRSFSNCQMITNIAIPNDTEKIYGNTFYGCTSLIDITDLDGNPISVQTIDGGAFSGCVNLISHISAEKVGGEAFYNCSKITKFTFWEIPSEYLGYAKEDWSYMTGPNYRIDRVGIKAFYGCTSLSNVYILDNVAKIQWSENDNSSGKISPTLLLNSTEMAIYLRNYENWIRCYAWFS